MTQATPEQCLAVAECLYCDYSTIISVWVTCISMYYRSYHFSLIECVHECCMTCALTSYTQIAMWEWSFSPETLARMALPVSVTNHIHAS